jgi:hypothetical protein
MLFSDHSVLFLKSIPLKKIVALSILWIFSLPLLLTIYSVWEATQSLDTPLGVDDPTPLLLISTLTLLNTALTAAGVLSMLIIVLTARRLN